MTEQTSEFEELRISIERLRTLLETLVVRGLRACGADEMGQIQSYTEQLDRSGAGHVAAVLAELHGHIEKDDRGSARVLLRAQTAVRLLERLLTLRVVGGQYAMAVAALEDGATDDGEGSADDGGEDEEDDE